MDKVTIIGLGMIGTSIGLALKKAKIENAVLVGADIDGSARRKAKKMGAVDQTERDILKATKNSNLIIIATPILAIREIMESIANNLQDGAIVTDTGSTKTEIASWADQYLPKTIDFIGGHPMAGKETSGPEGADPALFENRPYCLIPSKTASPKSVATLVAIVEAMKSIPYFLDANEHDSYVAGISHLPIVISAALVNLTTSAVGWKEMSKLASSGYKSSTRLASGDPAMSVGICSTNHEAVIYWIDEYIKQLGEVRKAMEENDDVLENIFIKAWEARARWIAGDQAEDTQERINMSDSVSQIFLGALPKRLAKLQDPPKDDKTKYKKR